MKSDTLICDAENSGEQMCLYLVLVQGGQGEMKSDTLICDAENSGEQICLIAGDNFNAPTRCVFSGSKNRSFNELQSKQAKQL